MTEEEKKELEALRAEKHSREQTERARTALSTAGVSVGFAALLVGTDDGHGPACAGVLHGISGKSDGGHQKAAARTDAHSDRSPATAPQTRHSAHSIRRKAG